MILQNQAIENKEKEPGHPIDNLGVITSIVRKDFQDKLTCRYLELQ